MVERLIRLRRPPVLHQQEEPFVPDVDAPTKARIEQRWTVLCKQNPAFFDGRVRHVLGMHRNGHGGASIHVMNCAYRYYAVQVGWQDLGVRTLGVKGITVHDGRALMGRRSLNVGQYPGLWEFAPSGGVDADARPQDAIVSELREEVGLEPRTEPVAIAILFDQTIRTWEIVYRIEPELVGVRAKRSAEYDEIRWCAPDGLPDDLSPIARQMVPLM